MVTLQKINVHKNEPAVVKHHQAEILHWVLESIQIHDSGLLGILFKSEILSVIIHFHNLPIYTQLHFLDVKRTIDYFSNGTKPFMLSCLWFLVKFPGPAHCRSQNNLVAA